MNLNAIDNLWEYLLHNKDIKTDNTSLLPLAHNTSSIQFRRILEENDGRGLFRPSNEIDDILDDKLLFFYYGLPVFYRVKTIEPCILVFKPKNLGFYKELNWSPIDTGVLRLIFDEKVPFNNKKLKLLGKEFFRKDFLLTGKALKKEADILLLKYIKLLFKNNKNYFKGISESIEDNKSIKILCDLFKQNLSEIELSDELNKEGYVNLDQRCKTIEGHTNIAIPFSNLELEYCYIPESQGLEEKIRNIYDNQNIKIDTYFPGIHTNDGFLEVGLEKYFEYKKIND